MVGCQWRFIRATLRTQPGAEIDFTLNKKGLFYPSLFKREAFIFIFPFLFFPNGKELVGNSYGVFMELCWQ